MYLTSLILPFAFFLTSFVIAQYPNKLVSPCPGVFDYEPESKEPDRWYGTITMLSDFDSYGIYGRVYLDKPALQLGNYYTTVYTENNKKFFLINPKDSLKKNVPKKVRIFVKYNTSEPPPVVDWLVVNARKICPVETTTTLAPSTQMELNPNPLGQVDNNDEDICGTIVEPTNGEPTKKGIFPWHASIFHAKGIDLTYVCAGSLISKDFVITVAHCVTKPRSTTTLEPDHLSVYLGKQNLKSFSNKGIQDRQISEVTIHPDFNPHLYSRDIALLQLAFPAEFNDYVRPICLWQDSPHLGTIGDKYGSIVGWGFDKNGMATDQLQPTELLVVSQATCLLTYPLHFVRISTENSFCAGFKNGSTVCNGDGGGGIVFPTSNSNPQNPVWQLRGLVSISAAQFNEYRCDSSHNVVFTDAVYYMNWIKKIIK